jgi:periplasmic protein TonB
VAFESFRAQDRDRPRRLRRIAFLLVAVFHGVLIGAGIVYSYWHVDELTPPTLRVTFMSEPPPPPPPPPPPAGGGGPRQKKVAIKTKAPEPVPEKPPEIVQPLEKTKPKKYERRKYDDEYEEKDDAKTAVGNGKGKGAITGDGDDDGEEDGVAGGVKGGQAHGIIGGTTGGTGLAPASPRMMPLQFGKNMLISGEMPDVPPSLNHGGLSYVLEGTICVSTTGAVQSLQITRGSDPLLIDALNKKVPKEWRYRPMHSGGVTIPYCFPARFEFNAFR